MKKVLLLVLLASACRFSFDRKLEPGQMHGRVVFRNANGELIPAENTNINIGGGLLLRSDARGGFTATALTLGNYDIKLSTKRNSEEYALLLRRITIDSGPARARDLGHVEIGRLGEIRGKVQPIEPGTTVVALVEGVGRTPVAADGSFTFPNLPASTYRVAVQVSGGATPGLFGPKDLKVPPGVHADVTINVRDEQPVVETANVRGNVVLAGSTKVAQATVTATNGVSTPIVVQTDDDGDFQLRQLPSGVYSLLVSQEGYSPGVITNVIAVGDVEVSTLALHEPPKPGRCPGDAAPDDSDGDGVPDACDICPNVSNPQQEDTDSDGVGDACDVCPSNANPDQSDVDHDGKGDVCDNCQFVANEQQEDADHDGLGDVCDNCPRLDATHADQTDSDQDGVGDVCDNCPTLANGDQVSTSGNGVGDACNPTLSISSPSDGFPVRRTVASITGTCVPTRTLNVSVSGGGSVLNSMCIADGPFFGRFSAQVQFSGSAGTRSVDFSSQDVTGTQTLTASVTTNVLSNIVPSVTVDATHPLQSVLDGASPNDILQLGTLNATSDAVTVTKPLTLEGAGPALTTIRLSGTVSGDWISVSSGGELNLYELTLDGTAPAPGTPATNTIGGAAIHVQGGALEMADSVLKNVSAGTIFGVGIAVDASGTSRVKLNGNTFSNIGRTTVKLTNAGVAPFEILGNTFHGKGTGTWLDYFVETHTGAALHLAGNTFDGMGGVVGADGARALVVADGSPFVMENNLISPVPNGSVAVSIEDSTATPAANSLVFRNNAFTGSWAGSTAFGLFNKMTTTVVQAASNWWGAATGPNSGGNSVTVGWTTVDGGTPGVVYSPWLTDDTNSAPDASGFYPVDGGVAP